MTINIIVAATENNAIGKDNKLLFHLKDDLNNFKKLTTGNIVIMGSKTYESIGTPLLNRINIVVSRRQLNNDNIIVADSLNDAIRKAHEISIRQTDKDVYIIGGGMIYQEALYRNDIDYIYLTRINKKINDADVFFPNIDYNIWDIKEVKSYTEGIINYDICLIAKKH